MSILGSAVGGEVWSINPVFDPNGEFPGSVDQTALDAAATAIAALTPGVTMMTDISSALALTGCRVEVRSDTDDSLIAIAIAPRVATGVGTGTPRLPPQSAAVISLRTNTPGARGRGRLYWPAVGVAVGTNLRNNSTNTSGLCTDFRAYSNAIRGALATAFPLIGFDLAVRSRANHATPHVVRVQVGDVIDTQRRRRDALIEAYSSIAIP